jgi:hypothetical protein
MPLFCKLHSGLLARLFGWLVHSSSPAYIVVVDASTAALTVKVLLVAADGVVAAGQVMGCNKKP